MREKNKQKEYIYKYGELFCGPGGLGLGASISKVKNGNATYKIAHEWASDYDEDSCKTYQENISSKKIICSDVKNLSIKNLSPIDIFAYGFPCNDFSIVGERKGISGEFGPLYSYGVKVLNHFKPIAFIAENVGGLKSANNGSALKTILNELANAGNGYNITANYYKFEEYGIPQTRHRVIIVGISKSHGDYFKVPAPSHKNTFVSARHVLEEIPIPLSAKNHEIKKPSETVKERLKHIKPGENAWTANLPKDLQLNVKGAKLSQIYKKLDPNKPSYTITGSGGGGTHGYHWKYNRELTNRERARIQTFPDNYIFHGSNESIRKQIGMAVSPLMSKIIFESLLKTLAGVPYKSIESNITIEKDLFDLNNKLLMVS